MNTAVIQNALNQINETRFLGNILSHHNENISNLSFEEVARQLIPQYLETQLQYALIESLASEHAARMTAMDNATNACKDMIHDLTQLYNKARQSAITSELMDIVGGAEALKG